MKKSISKKSLSIAKVLELIGKPILLLFTIIVVIFTAYVHLLTLFVQKIRTKFKQIKPPSLPKIPNPTLTLPQFSLPKLNALYLLILFAVSITTWYFYSAILKDLPNPTQLKENTPALSTKILDRNGTILYQIYKDENRSLITLDALPKHLINATIAAEDKNFYHHLGVDPTGIARALYNNLRTCNLSQNNCSPQGGSTITQQLIKNTLLTSEKTLTRKLKEFVLALLTEQQYQKNEILEMYLNQVPYGGTAYGIEEASKQYLGKSAKELNLAEAAFLAGLPVSPTTLSPFGTTPYLAKIRQQQVLENMVSLKMITENEKLIAISTPINLNVEGSAILAPHFVMYIRDLLVKLYGESTVSRGGLTVTTTLDLATHNLLQAEIEKELSKLEKLNVTNGAGLIVSPQTGEILAMVGSRNFFDTKNDGQVNITLQPRQPGSAIKPLTYTLAFMQGLSPSSYIEDSPICFRQPGSTDYCPKNYDGKFHGKVTLKTALASSYNIPAIKLLNSLGVNNLVELGRAMGITTWIDPSRFGLSLTLGGGEVTMFDLAQAYSVFATQGSKVSFNPLLSVTNSAGDSLPIHTKSSTQIIPESVAFQINQALSDNAARAPAFGTNSVLTLKDKTVAVKTGTTNNLRDNWTFGYTSNLLVATWVGNNNNSPMSSIASGITGASPIWNRTISELLKDQSNTPFLAPTTIVKAKTSCETNHYDYFIKGLEPKLNCEKKETGEIL